MRRSQEFPAGWLSITELSVAKGVDQSAISRRVERLASQGLLSIQRQGKLKLVNLAEFERVADATVDAVRELNSRGVPRSPLPFEPDNGDPVLAREQARRVSIQADLAQIQLDKERGQLLPVQEVQEAMARAGGELIRTLETPPGRASDIVSALARDGERGVRAILRQIVRDARERLASAMTVMAMSAEADLDEDALVD